MVLGGEKNSASVLGVISYLTGGDELQRAQGDLEVGGVGLEVEQSLSNALLELRGVLPRGAVGRDLVEGLAGHLD